MQKLPQKILVIMPHPDDEALLCAGLISRAVEEKREISVCIVTTGDYLCKDFTKGIVRLTESYNALLSLGVNDKNIFFLGYPDTGFTPEVSFITALKNTANDTEIFKSKCSAQTYGIPNIKEDYSFLSTGKHSAYCKKEFISDIIRLLHELEPKLIVTTSQWDIHADHSALSYFVRELVTQVTTQNYAPVIWEGIVHSPAGDENWPQKGTTMQRLTMPAELEETTDLKWEKRISLPVPKSMNALPADNVKYKLIESYETALDKGEPETVEYLLSFSKLDEVFFVV